MKQILILIPLVLTIGCATQRPVIVQLPAEPPPMPRQDLESVRYAESVKA